MAALCLTLSDLTKLRPCAESSRRVRALLRKLNADEAHCFTAAEARDAGCTFDDIMWAASAVARTDEEVKLRLRHWMADCAARVLHLYERDYPADTRVRDAITAARDYADGKIDDAALATARDAALAAALAAASDAARAAATAATRDAAWAAWAAARDAARTAEAAAREAARAAWAAREAAWAASAAARAAAREAERAFQFDRLILWLSPEPPQPLRLPARQKKAA